MRCFFDFLSTESPAQCSEKSFDQRAADRSSGSPSRARSHTFDIEAPAAWLASIVCDVIGMHNRDSAQIESVKLRPRSSAASLLPNADQSMSTRYCTAYK